MDHSQKLASSPSLTRLHKHYNYRNCFKTILVCLILCLPVMIGLIVLLCDYLSMNSKKQVQIAYSKERLHQIDIASTVHFTYDLILFCVKQGAKHNQSNTAASFALNFAEDANAQMLIISNYLTSDCALIQKKCMTQATPNIDINYANLYPKTVDRVYLRAHLESQLLTMGCYQAANLYNLARGFNSRLHDLVLYYAGTICSLLHSLGIDTTQVINNAAFNDSDVPIVLTSFQNYEQESTELATYFEQNINITNILRDIVDHLDDEENVYFEDLHLEVRSETMPITIMSVLCLLMSSALITILPSFFFFSKYDSVHINKYDTCQSFSNRPSNSDQILDINTGLIPRMALTRPSDAFQFRGECKQSLASFESMSLNQHMASPGLTPRANSASSSDVTMHRFRKSTGIGTRHPFKRQGSSTSAQLLKCATGVMGSSGSCGATATRKLTNAEKLWDTIIVDKDRRFSIITIGLT